ncbi:BrnT family toxin [Allohahella sp. A8]|uniref:BrnT family toxin n=1 Tax=Allohahella sp. A8 TaxID=3141461 RepID=UPI003A80272D
MHHLTFQWDAAKSESNLRKHGVSFEEAKTVFTDEFGRLLSDPDHSEADEDRFLLLGTSIHSKLLVVCHCIREQECIRIISARKAEKRERKLYERFRHA